jgi:hypothetical protein
MTSNLPFGNNPISVYLYEPFSFTISNSEPRSFALTTTRTSGIPSSYLTLDGSLSAIFATSSNGMTPGSEQFTVSKVDVCGTILATSTNNVTVGAGRFLDGSGLSFVGSNFTFYAKEAITPIKLRAPFFGSGRIKYLHYGNPLHHFPADQLFDHWTGGRNQQDGVFHSSDRD